MGLFTKTKRQSAAAHGRLNTYDGIVAHARLYGVPMAKAKEIANLVVYGGDPVTLQAVIEKYGKRKARGK